MADRAYPSTKAVTTKHRNGVTSTMTNADSPPPQPPPNPDSLSEDAAREVAVPAEGIHLDETWRRRFMVKRDNREFVLYAGLLDLGHQLGLKGISTSLVQVPSELNLMVAIVHATAEFADGREFQGLGDASPQNVTRMMAPHLIRMAETRAKARALRDATNVGVTAFEELGEGPDRQDGDREAVPAAHEPAWRSPGGAGAAPRRAQPPLAGEARPEQRAAITRLLLELGQPPFEGDLSAADAGRRIMELQEQLRQVRAGGPGARA